MFTPFAVIGSLLLTLALSQAVVAGDGRSEPPTFTLHTVQR
jgi:hypothetical protein